MEANLNLHLELAEQASDVGAGLCVFPELSLTGYFLKDLVPEVAMSLDDPRLKPLLDLSRRVDLVVGMALRTEDFQFHNAAVYLSGGGVRHVHRKVYLPTYGMFDEQRYFAAGDRIRAFNALSVPGSGGGGLAAGMLICEDLWHLSAAYLLFVQGISLLICPSAGPGRGVLADPNSERGLGSAESWGDLCRTVAQFSGCYVAYCNRTGYEDGVYFWGGSGIFGPDGSPVALAEGTAVKHGEPVPQGNQVVYADIDAREVERQRVITPLLRDEKVDFTLRELERIWDERTAGPY
ncbi:MAG TPA: nitrilase-related carbon-nitrogen hydrolase [Candidatus Dormibacteraeota bacterium]|nr:nitrilase-related carbon-nitrogen hydrolase [Candidatus Dormibacteraeota bacterium]